MKYKLLNLLSLSCILLFSSISIVEAHPGRTAADGCHYCRTNCDQWGVAWNERHCHGGSGGSSSGDSSGGSNVVQETVQTQEVVTLPTNTSIPLRLPTKPPTRIPTRTPTPTVTVTPSPTATPSPTTTPKKKAKPVQANVQAAKQPGFFDWLMRLFRGR
jgi:hypothetical protein